MWARRAPPTRCGRDIEPDMKISRIRLSGKTSRLYPRHVVPKPAQAHEPEVLLQDNGTLTAWQQFTGAMHRSTKSAILTGE
jgi:hypothetical protein